MYAVPLYRKEMRVFAFTGTTTLYTLVNLEQILFFEKKCATGIGQNLTDQWLNLEYNGINNPTLREGYDRMPKAKNR